jgi:anti-sigma B factor antagonist
MCGSLLLVTTKLFGATTGAITAALLAVPFALLWFAAPLYRRAERGPAPRPRDHAAQRPNPVRYDSGVGAQEHLRVDAQSSEDRVVLRLTGELDLASSSIFERALERPEVTASALLVLDLDELKFVDSTGLRVILMAHEGARARGQEFAITQGSPQVQRLLSITSVAEHMRVIASPDDLPV